VVAAAVARISLCRRRRGCYCSAPPQAIATTLPLLLPLLKQWQQQWQHIVAACSREAVEAADTTILCCYRCPATGYHTNSAAAAATLLRRRWTG